MMRRKQLSRRAIAEAEALFLSLMSADATPENWDRYQYLVQTSSEHRRIFARCAAVWQGLDEIGPSRLLGANVVMDDASDPHARSEFSAAMRPGLIPASLPLSALLAVGRWLQDRRRWLAVGTMIVAALVVAGLGLWSVVSLPPQILTYATQTGEHKAVELRDGSTLLLGARSMVNVRYTDTLRLIELVAGEMLVTVAPDDGQPFIVKTDDMMVMATGTAFNIRNGRKYSTVSVVEGTVRVVPRAVSENIVDLWPNQPVWAPTAFDAGASLHPGEQLQAASNATIGSIKEVDINRVLSWQSGQLNFIEDDLASVFEVLMRYSDLTFELTDQAIGERIFTGSFRVDKVDVWLDAIERAYALKVTRLSSDWIVIAPRS